MKKSLNFVISMYVIAILVIGAVAGVIYYSQSRTKPIEMGFQLAAEKTCDSNNLKLIENKLQETQSDEQFLLLQFQHYLILKERIEECPEDPILILFFYSNKPEYVLGSKKQKEILLDIQEELGTRIKIYDINTNLDMVLVDYLKDLNKIQTYPTIVIEDQVYSGLTSKDILKQNLQSLKI